MDGLQLSRQGYSARSGTCELKDDQEAVKEPKRFRDKEPKRFRDSAAGPHPPLTM